MMSLLGNIIFLNPWVLAGLAGLPLLWFLLRIMPPAPRLIALPTTRFLKDLIPETQTPSHTPWWILLLRILIIALILLALAGPVYNPAGQLAGSGPLRLIIDNSWPAGKSWNTQIKAAEETLTQAGRERREVFILTTAPAPNETKPASYGPLPYGEALSIVRGLNPLPWPADYTALADIIRTSKGNYTNMWFGHGLDEGKIETAITALQSSGSVTYYGPDAGNMPLLLAAPETPSQALQITLKAPSNIARGTPVAVQALTQDGRVLDSHTVALDPQKPRMNINFDIPETLRNDVSMFRIAGHKGAGAAWILDDRYRKHSVGIVSPPEKAENAPFVEAAYYLKRALEPYTSVTLGDAASILEQSPSVIVLPDIDAMPVDILNKLEEWVRQGGLLLRFAGPNMTRNQTENYLVPVPLRKGGRALDGSLTWEQPQKLAPFDASSPFYGLKINDDITVRQQVLPEITTDLDEKTWARLTDGTPLITAGPLDQGLLVLIHTTATPEWSDLALSGLYVGILRRLVSMSGGSYNASDIGSGALDPILVFDGYGAVREPAGYIRPIPAEEFSELMPSSAHPPGLYGRSGFQQAFNLGNYIKTLSPVMELPGAARVQSYGGEYERDLMPDILYIALLLAIADWAVMMIIAAGLRPFWRFASVLFLLCMPVQSAHAQSIEEQMRYADGLYLAYVRTGNAAIDSTSQSGLEALSTVLKRRTSVEPDGVVGVNPESDELAFFPILYWAISADQAQLSPTALGNIQNYLDHGGTILFDTRDENYAASAVTGTRNAEALRRMVGSLNVPPLIPIPEDHVLTKSFYLIDSFPGRFTGGTLWVEQQSTSGRDGVSSIIVGSHDWANAWSADRGSFGAMAGGSRQQEMANRFGVNLVVYALTGNYKSDQVHVPFILERLGQ